MRSSADLIAIGLMSSWSLACAERAYAHSGPQVRTIFFEGADKLTLLVANRGFILGEPARGNWQLMCNEALGINVSERADVAKLPDGTLLVATSHGLITSSDRGCSWSPVAGLGSEDMPWNTPALTQVPGQPNKLFLTAPAPGASGLRVSSDGGKTWILQLAAADTDFLRYIRIARSDPRRMYLSKTAFGTSKFHFSVMSSSDAGATWTEAA